MIEKNKSGPPRKPSDKEKAPMVAGPDGAFNKHSLNKANNYNVQANNTTDRMDVNHSAPVGNLKSGEARRLDLSTKPLPNLRHWSVLENFKRNLSNAVTTQPTLFEDDKLRPATPRQINYLVKLYHLAGQKEFARIKTGLGITRKVPDLTRHEASILIRVLKTRDQEQGRAYILQPAEVWSS